jgi:metallo-beta-lactamase class B
MWKPFSVVAFAALFAVASLPAGAQVQVHPLPITNPDFLKPFPPFRIVGNLHYVGTYDLAVYLLATKDGNILINTGVNDSAPMIRSNIEKLGLRFSDIKLLLATHGHWDHVGAMAEVKRLTGARMLMHEDDADLLETGGGRDYRFPEGRGTIYEPIKVDRRLKEGDKVRLGEVELTVIHHPGHTKGATSFAFTAEDGSRKFDVLIVNMGTINPGVNVTFMPAYPGINEAYSTTLARQKKLNPGIWVSSHAGHFDLHKKYQPGDAYDPKRFVDPDGYLFKILFYEKLFNAALQRDRGAEKR